MSYKNTNVGMIGSQEDLHARLVASGKEPAWNTAGKEAGLQIWRIEKFKVVPWPKESYGCFFNGDSYIVMSTYKKGPTAFGWDIHFWLGKNTTQDESGTAAYKTVELDDHLGGGPVEYREVQGFESTKFRNYFDGKITVIDGGIESGFHHVTATESKPVLFWVKGGRHHIRVKPVPVSKDSLNSGDVFILANGQGLIQWNGASSSAFEKSKGNAICQTLRFAHPGATLHISCIEERDDCEAFWTALGGKGPVKSAREGGLDKDVDAEGAANSVLYQLSDASGAIKFSQVGAGKLPRALLKPDDVYVLDTGSEIFAWVGRGSSANERRNTMHYAQQYLKMNNRPMQLSICRVLDGNEPEHFWSSFEF